MKLLGAYASKLNSFHYQALLALLEQSVAAGDFAGGKAFDAAAAAKLQQQGQDFETLPLPSAGQRVTDESLNYPLSLLDARFAALTSETADFTKQAGILLAMLARDTRLLDQVLAAANARAWAATLPQLSDATIFAWDFAGGHGAVSADIPVTDPVNQVPYTGRPPQIAVLDCNTGTRTEGIAAPASQRWFNPKLLSWQFTPTDGGESEEASGDFWAKLSLLDAAPRLTFADQPVYDDSIKSYFEVTGAVANGSVPIHVNVHFLPRRSSARLRIAKGAQVPLTVYRVQPDEVDVVVDKVYTGGVDFTVSAAGVLTSVNLPEDADLVVYFTEYFPAFQCSVNGVDWSRDVMLDPARPYPEDTTDFTPLAVQGDRFALTDELGVPTGLWLRMTAPPPAEQKFTVTTPSSTTYGARVVMEVELDKPGYMTGLHLEPFTSYPAILEKAVCVGVSADDTTLFEGSVLLDRGLTLQFSRTMVRKILLTLRQENYTIKEHTLDVPDRLRRETLSSLQPLLPFAVRRTEDAFTRTVRGYQYEFGFENIYGEDTARLVPGVLVTGPYRVEGIADVLRLDVVSEGELEVYLHHIAHGSGGMVVDENLVGVEVTPGTAWAVPFSDTLDRTRVLNTDFYLKFVFRSADAVLERMALQVSHA